ncbi:MAG: polysaccharide deacetylase family protein [Saprospiraceae bacterium]|nr:polysaccharide deacetylase family protein [Saprospiraceae bacterium]
MVIWNIPSDNTLFLTFDDGPHPDSTPLLLSMLQKAQAKASFFLLGSNAEKYPDLVEQIINAGHTVACHGYKHLNGWKTPKKAYVENVMRCQSILKSTLFRPPFGRLKLSQFRALTQKFKLIMWSHMPGDFDKNLNTKQLIKRVMRIPSNGSIVVLHDSPQTITSCQIALEAMLNRPDVQFKRIEI